MKLVSVMTSDARGGAEYAAVDLLDALAAQGHETVLLTDQPELADGRRVRARRVDLGPKLSRRSLRPLAVRWPLIAAELARELRREAPYDVLHSHYKKEQLLTAVMPARLRPTVAWSEWGPVPSQLRTGPGRLAYTHAARRADLIMAVSPGTRDSIIAAGVPPGRVHVVPNALGVEARRFRLEGRARLRRELGIPDTALVAGVISRLNRKKRNDVAVDAVIALARDDLHLVIAGEGEMEAELRARAAPLGRLAHFAPTPGESITDLLSAFDVSIFCPSPTEGAPLAVMYAMLAGRPLVASGREGAAGLIPPGGGTIVTPDHNVEATAAALRAYLDDPGLRARTGEVSRAYAQRTFAAASVGALADRLLTAVVTPTR